MSNNDHISLIVTIDTEEDNWGNYDIERFSLENIQRISGLQDIFNRFGINPTYLVTYPVATDPSSITVLKKIHESGKCEIGAHCHPWNTPPFEEQRNGHNSMLLNLSTDLQIKKIKELNQSITKSFGIQPESFRAGRWGFGKDTAFCLAQAGIKNDTSILAFQNWSEYDGPDYSDITPKVFQITTKVGSGKNTLLEIPASAGYSIGSFVKCNKLYKILEQKITMKFHIKGILSRLGILKKIWLSPETASAAEMVILTNAMIRQGYNILNMFFHSTALKAGLSPFVRTKDDEHLFLKKIEDYLQYLKSIGVQSIKLSDARSIINVSSLQASDN